MPMHFSSVPGLSPGWLFLPAVGAVAYFDALSERFAMLFGSFLRFGRDGGEQDRAGGGP